MEPLVHQEDVDFLCSHENLIFLKFCNRVNVVIMDKKVVWGKISANSH